MAHEEWFGLSGNHYIGFGNLKTTLFLKRWIWCVCARVSACACACAHTHLEIIYFYVRSYSANTILSQIIDASVELWLLLLGVWLFVMLQLFMFNKL